MFVFQRAAVAALALVVLALPAGAQTRPSEQAAEMMARAQALDLKCGIFDAHDRDKLSKFSSRAELALANRESVDVSKAATQRGKTAGDAAACSADERATIRMLLSAALQASGEPPLAETPDVAAIALATDSTSAPTESQPPVATVADATAVAKPVPPRALANPPRLAMPKSNFKLSTAVKPVGGLGTYERLTAAYYLARRCGGNQNGTYRAVLAEHGRVMRNHSAAEVAAVLRRAEIRAGNSSCS